MRSRIARGLVLVMTGALATIGGFQLLKADGETAAIASQDPGRTLPVYDEEGALLRPQNFEEWILVGASIGLGYSDRARPASAGPGMFHNVYLEPGAYRHYVATGEFPEKTMLALAMYRSSQEANPAKQGYYEGEFVALEIALKDHERFEEGWVYVPFNPDSLGSLPDRSRALPKETGCYGCHVQHAADDNVFVQFYPVLRPVLQRHADADARREESEP